MRIIGVHSRVSPVLIAGVLLLQLSPALATGQPDARQDRRGGPVEVTFTKWRTAVIPPTTGVPMRYLFKGSVGGDLGAGDFVAEVLDREASTPCTAVAPPVHAEHHTHDHRINHRAPCNL